MGVALRRARPESNRDPSEVIGALRSCLDSIRSRPSARTAGRPIDLRPRAACSKLFFVTLCLCGRVPAVRSGIEMAIRVGLFKEVIVMAFDTVRTNKMRSALTVLGVVIGITSIVGMTAMIRGFDQSFRDSIGAIGPNTIFIQRFGIASFSGIAEFRKLLKRPNLSISDARALEQQATTLQFVDVELGAGVGPSTQRRIFYRDSKTRNLLILGTSEFFEE